MKKELGFIALISIVISSQLGSGVFVFPSLMAPFGAVGIFGWIVSACGAITLALIFSELSSNMPRNGGPHVYVTEAFGRTAGFFTAWVYWIISWSSNSILLVTTIYYLSIITGKLSPVQVVTIETLTLFAATYVNIMGVRTSGLVETWLTVLKVVPLLLLPAVFFMHFEPSNFSFSIESGTISSTIAKTALLTCWGFIGVECATTPADMVKNPKRVIPRSIIIGTTFVAIIFVLNTISVLGITGFEALENSNASYSIAAEKVLGHSSTILISILAIIVCIGTLNAWILTGGQIARGAAHDGLFPPIFGKLNKNGAPVYTLLFASIGIVPFFIIEQMYGSGGLDQLIGFLVSIFIFVYLISCAAYIKMFRQWRTTKLQQIKGYIMAIIAVIFCLFIVVQDIVMSTAILLGFILFGFPIHMYMKKRG